MKKEFQAGTKDEQRTNADSSTSASVEANPMLSAAFSLGQKIKIKSVLKRRVKFTTDSKYGFSNRFKEWVEVPIGKEREVIIVGVRNLSNGKTDWDSEAGYMYNAESYLKALLVVGSMREKPFYVLCSYGSR